MACCNILNGYVSINHADSRLCYTIMAMPS